MLRLLHHLWKFRNEFFWPIWISTTVLATVLTAWFASKNKTIGQDSLSRRDKTWPRRVILAIGFLAVLLAFYIAGSLVWEDFTYYDNSYFTNGTIVGKNIPLQILPSDGRFFPLGHQEYNLIRHFTTSVVGYHSLRIIQLVLLCGLLLFFDGELNIWARFALIILVLVTPGFLISFSGLIYPEWNVIFALVCLAWSVKRFEQTQSGGWAAAAVISSQVMLYYKETAFLLLLGFTVGRLLLRCWNASGPTWDLKRLREPESRLDICLTLLGAFFFVYYLAAMYPNYNTGYADEAQLPLTQILISYVQLDLLVWILAAVLLVRIVQILRRKSQPMLLWDGLALGAVGCLVAYLILRMNAGYFLAPADIIAILYLGHFIFLSLEKMTSAQKLCAASLLALVVLQDFSLSAFRMYERKNVIHAKAEIAKAIKRQYESDPASVNRLFFPFAQPFHIMEFVSYLNYIGVPVEQVPAAPATGHSVVIAGRVFQTDTPCGYRAFMCHPGGEPNSGDLIVVLPDDFTRPDELDSYQREDGPLFSYQPRPSIPQWLFPYVSALHVVSPIFSQHQLPDSWLNASVTVWQRGH
jgi:hypothetical protein